jgi:Transposase DDE domain group 1
MPSGTQLTTLREKLVKIGARIVRHGRYVIFQLAEVAVPRPLFAEILRRIERLRPRRRRSRHEDRER